MTRATVAKTALFAAAVMVVEWVLAAPGGQQGLPGFRFALSLGLGAAASLSRVVPLASLALMIVVEGVALLSGSALATDELVMAVVMYHCARHGECPTLWISGFLMPAAYVLTGAFLVNPGTEAAQRIDRSGLTDDPIAIALLVVTIASPLALPWLLGLTLRWRAKAERGRLALLRAEGESEVKEQQAKLTRDVHDVVGHSLAVILAQAESVRYLAVPTPPEVLGILDTIADSARSSLTEVRHVLTADSPRPAVTDLDELIAKIPASAATLRNRVVGTPRPMPPDTASIAHRVLQEMLTNALKHGDGGEIDVLRDWHDGLRIAVGNGAADSHSGAADSHFTDGMGLAGMRQRVQAAQGVLEVRRDQARFTVEARIPLPGGRVG